MICCCPRLARAWRRGSRATKLAKYLERVKGIEPSSSAWKAVALPLSYTRELERALSNRDARLRPIRLRPKTGFGGQEAGFGGQVGWLASRSAAGAKAGGGGRTRTYEGVSQRIYSPPPLPLGTLPRRRRGILADARSSWQGGFMGSALLGVNRTKPAPFRGRQA